MNLSLLAVYNVAGNPIKCSAIPLFYDSYTCPFEVRGLKHYINYKCGHLIQALLCREKKFNETVTIHCK